MSNGNLPSRTKRVVGAVGTTAAITAIGVSAAAGPAQASPYATGWQCISPFANFTNNQFPSEPPAPNGIIDSLAITVARPGGDPMVATPGARLPLHDVKLALDIRDPRIVEQLYTRTGGVTISYGGVPLGQPAGDGTVRSLSKLTVGAETIAPTAINGGGTAPSPGEQWWVFTERPEGPSVPADKNSGWYADSSGGRFTRTYYVEQVDGDNPPQDNAGGFLAPSPSVGHKYVTHTGNNHFPINGWVVIEAANTVEKVQTVQAKGYWTVHVEDSTPGSLADPSGYSDGGHSVTAPPVVLDLPRSNWTPTGSGPVTFRVADPGQATSVPIESTGYDRPGYHRPVLVKPFGSVFVRAGTEAYGASNDCIPGAIGVADNSIAASFWGNARPDASASNPDTSIGSPSKPGFLLGNDGWVAAKGAAGRYSLAATTLPAFAAAPLAAAPKPVVPTVPYAAKALKVRSGALKKSKKNRVTLKVSNPNTKAAKYKITVRTVSSYKIGTGKRKKQTVVSSRTVTAPAGKTKSASLKLSKAGRSLLKSRKRVKVQVTVTPTDRKVAAKASKKLNLKR